MRFKVFVFKIELSVFGFRYLGMRNGINGSSSWNSQNRHISINSEALGKGELWFDFTGILELEILTVLNFLVSSWRIDSYCTNFCFIDSYSTDFCRIDSFCTNSCIDSYCTNSYHIDSYGTNFRRIDSYCTNSCHIDSYGTNFRRIDSHGTNSRGINAYCSKPCRIDSLRYELLSCWFLSIRIARILDHILSCYLSCTLIGPCRFLVASICSLPHRLVSCEFLRCICHRFIASFRKISSLIGPENPIDLIRS